MLLYLLWGIVYKLTLENIILNGVVYLQMEHQFVMFNVEDT